MSSAISTTPSPIQRIARHPSAVLLVVQALAVLLYPFLETSRSGAAVLSTVSMCAVGIALWAVRSNETLGMAVFALGLPALALTVAEAALPNSDSIALASAAFHAPFYFYVSYGMIRYLFHDNVVTSDELYATGAAFTVVAWGFAHLFVIVEVVWAGSFAPLHDGPQRFFELLFLSFTNLTSVGLSDIVPVLDHARSIVMVEQVVGVMYVALVISRMVGLTVSRSR